MRVPDLIRMHPLWLGALLGGILGAVIGLFLPIRAPEATDARNAAWRLPTLAATRNYTEGDAASARGATYWGEQSRASRRDNQRVTWTLKAIATRPTVGIAIAHGSRNEITWVALRGTLPDGGVLVAVDRDTAWIERDGCRFARALYANPTDAGSDPCASPGAALNSPPPNRLTQQKTDTP